MCGITGIFNLNDRPADLSILQKMNRRLAHRGPDDEGYFIDGSVGLAQRRLSIIDLSSGGHQPMTSADGRYTIVFNGEIYNYIELKKELESKGQQFKTHSDTEVLLYLYIIDGIDCLNKLNGMFAFAIWDKQERKLFAARDRFGKKPFYYWTPEGSFIFASECKSFLEHPDFKRDLDPVALSHFFQYEYIPEPYSIFKGVSKLPAGHYLIKDSQSLTIRKFWDVPLKLDPTQTNEKEIQERIISLLDQAVSARLVSDVPLGVFLSGGVDSSAVVALMARHREGRDIKTFSINFNEKSFDESEYSSLIAKKFNTDHHAQTLSPQKMIEILPEVASFMDEPFADYSIIPTYLLSKFTREHVTVALGGDGSDELFAGYPTFHAGYLATPFYRSPKWLRGFFNLMSQWLPVSDRDMSFEFKLKQFLYGAGFPPVIRNQVWLGAFHKMEQQQLFANDFELQGYLKKSDPLDLVREAMRQCPSRGVGDQMLYFYQKFYLSGDILVKTDRASMAASLEVRAPFLDKNLVEYVSTLPFKLKGQGPKTKVILKKALEPYLPHDIIYRGKKGFGIPIASWLKKELRSVMIETLHPDRIKKEGVFNPLYVNRLVQDHLEGKRNNRKQLFSLLMFQWWREKFV